MCFCMGMQTRTYISHTSWNFLKNMSMICWIAPLFKSIWIRKPNVLFKTFKSLSFFCSSSVQIVCGWKLMTTFDKGTECCCAGRGMSTIWKKNHPVSTHLKGKPSQEVLDCPRTIAAVPQCLWWWLVSSQCCMALLCSTALAAPFSPNVVHDCHSCCMCLLFHIFSYVSMAFYNIVACFVLVQNKHRLIPL